MDPKPSVENIARLPLFPKFSLENQEIDALVPSCRVESWQKFAEILNAEHSKSADDMVFRGHRRCDWPLESTLARQFRGGSISPSISKSLLDKFRLAMRGRGYDLTDKSENEIWAFGQHFGLATPLLDWTESPFVALFFAFLKEDDEHERENPTRAVFRINRSLIAEVLPDLFFEPTLGENARLVNQAGLFTVTPEGGDNLVSAIINAITYELALKPDDPDELSRYICKFHIPNEDRVGCLNSLRRMNIHHANLFPDPMGASEYCNDWLARAVSEERQKSEEKATIAEREARVTKHIDVHGSAHAYNCDLNDIIETLSPYVYDAESSLDVADLSQRLNEKYEESYSIDWPNHESGTARIRTIFKRILRSAGLSETSREMAVDALIQVYTERYWKSEGKI